MPKRLFCFSGGGLTGLDIHAGMLLGLADLGIVSDANAGTSAGAIIAAVDASGMSAQNIYYLVKSLKDSDVLQKRWFWKLRFMHLDSIAAATPVRNLIEARIPATFEELKKPLAIFSTDDTSALSIVSTSGAKLREAVYGSMAIPGVFPAAHSASGHPISDGGTSAILPLPANWQSFDEVYLLIARPVPRFRGRGIVGRLLWSIDLLLEDQLLDIIALARAAAYNKVRVLRPPLSLYRGSLHFDHDLIHIARSWILTELIGP
jgi:NTE family protein